MNIVVIGGAGYIGSELVKKKGHRWTIIDRMDYFQNRTKLSFGANTNFIESDILDIDKTLASLKNADWIIWAINPKSFVFENNPENFMIPITTSLYYILSVCSHHDVRFMFLSDWKVYGSPCSIIMDTKEIVPNTMFSQFISMLENTIIGSGTRSLILRVADVFGASEKPDIDSIYNRVCWDIATKNCFFKYDYESYTYVPFIHIQDIVECIVSAVERDIVNTTIDCYHRTIDLATFYGQFEGLYKSYGIPHTESVNLRTDGVIYLYEPSTGFATKNDIAYFERLDREYEGDEQNSLTSEEW